MINVIKLTAGLGTSAATGFVIGTTMNMVKPQNLTKAGTVMWKVGVGAISGMVGVAASRHVEEIIDDVATAFTSIKKSTKD